MHFGDSSELDGLTEMIIGCGIRIHRTLGPGLVESAYGHCMAYELRQLGLNYEREKICSIKYGSVTIDAAYRLDFLVENKVVLELKAVTSLLPVHKVQLRSYLVLTQIPVGLLMNFHAPTMLEGITRCGLSKSSR